MSVGLRIALVVPDYRHAWEDDRHCRVRALRAACKVGDVDVVVFPEAYEGQDGRDLQSVADEWAEYFNAPTVVGIATDDGFQTAVFRNPNPERGETSKHIYVKHSTANKVAFEWPCYEQEREAMFQPILLKDRKLAVQICHDMFFGLIGQRMSHAGADVFLDLTGGGVNHRKWTNVVMGRSIELAAPFLCTMAKRPDENGASRALAFDAGRVLQPMHLNAGTEGFGGYGVYGIARPNVSRPDVGSMQRDQAFTEKRYRDITISTTRKADIVVNPTSGALELCERAVPSDGSWHGFENQSGRIGVLQLALDSLRDGLLLYRHAPLKGSFDHHVVIYFSAEPQTSSNEALAMATLRAIEHRIGVVVIAGSRCEVLKTNRYKNVQRFRDIDGVFGLNAEFLGGTWSTAGTAPSLGIPSQFFGDYLRLID